MLERFAVASAFDEVAEGGEFGFGERAVEVHVELHAAAVEDLGEEVLHVEPGVIDPGFFEVGGAGADGIEDGFHAARGARSR